MKRMVNVLGNLSGGKRTYAVFALYAMTAIALPAQTFTTLHSFDDTDGAQPYAGLVQATNGDLYGTTYAGGANNNGTVFKITPSGTPPKAGARTALTPWRGSSRPRMGTSTGQRFMAGLTVPPTAVGRSSKSLLAAR